MSEQSIISWHSGSPSMSSLEKLGFTGRANDYIYLAGKSKIDREALENKRRIAYQRSIAKVNKVKDSKKTCAIPKYKSSINPSNIDQVSKRTIMRPSPVFSAPVVERNYNNTINDISKSVLPVSYKGIDTWMDNSKIKQRPFTSASSSYKSTSSPAEFYGPGVDYNYNLEHKRNWHTKQSGSNLSVSAVFAQKSRPSSAVIKNKIFSNERAKTAYPSKRSNNIKNDNLKPPIERRRCATPGSVLKKNSKKPIPTPIIKIIQSYSNDNKEEKKQIKKDDDSFLLKDCGSIMRSTCPRFTENELMVRPPSARELLPKTLSNNPLIKIDSSDINEIKQKPSYIFQKINRDGVGKKIDGSWRERKDNIDMRKYRYEEQMKLNQVLHSVQSRGKQPRPIRSPLTNETLNPLDEVGTVILNSRIRSKKRH